MAGSLLVLLSACVTPAPELAPIDPRGVRVSAPVDDSQRRDRRGDRRRGEGLTPPHAVERADELVRIALLLPFSSRSSAARAEADAMFKAAQLALFERGHDRLLLIPKDTAGTAAGARSAALAAERDGADVILGPLFAVGVEAAAAAVDTEELPVIAFSNDRSAAGSGALLMGLAPEDEVSRMVEYALRQGLRRFATLAPDNTYGQRVRDALSFTAIQYGGELSNYELYAPSASADTLTRPARALAKYDQRRAYNQRRGSAPAPAPQEPVARVVVDPDGTVRTVYETPRQGFDVGYDAILLPSGGVQLQTIAPLMPYYDVDPRRVRFMGTSLWRDERVLEEPSLQRGWFVDTDPQSRQAFERSFGRAYDDEPSRLSSLAYDAVTLVSFLTNPGQPRGGVTRETLSSETGFFGVDGIFRFREDGIAERGLAVLEIRDGAFRVLEPAPRSFSEIAALPRPAVTQPVQQPGAPSTIPRPPSTRTTGGVRTSDGIPRPTY